MKRIRPLYVTLLLALWAAAFSYTVAVAAPGTPARLAAPAAAHPDTLWSPPTDWAPQPISRDEFAARRAALAERLGDGVFLALGAVEPPLEYLPYAQESNFRYLTGVTEPGAALAMVVTDGAVHEMIFVRPRDPAREVWEGRRLGTGGAGEFTGIGDARTIDGLHPALDSLLAIHATLYTPSPPPAEAGRGDHMSPRQQEIAQIQAAHPGVRVVGVADELQRLRAFKSPAELDLIRAAIYISNLAHLGIMRALEPGMNEFEIHGIVEYTFFRYGGERPAYSPIVGSGPNSTTLHYRQNDRFMTGDDVLLVDVGASYQGYAADVTRTMPVDGTFSPEQRAIYQIVLDAQKAAEAHARPGASWQELSQAAERVIAQGLAELGLIDAPDATYVCESPRFGQRCPQFRLYYMHSLGHGVGLDVHDPDPSYFEAFQAGSVVTIEPGVYIRADALDHLPDTPENQAMARRLRPTLERYRDIGVRIEDTYIFTEAGVDRVSAPVPREIDEVEALLATERIGRRDRHGHAVDWYRAMPQR